MMVAKIKVIDLDKLLRPSMPSEDEPAGPLLPTSTHRTTRPHIARADEQTMITRFIHGYVARRVDSATSTTFKLHHALGLTTSAQLVAGSKSSEMLRRGIQDTNRITDDIPSALKLNTEVSWRDAVLSAAT